MPKIILISTDVIWNPTTQSLYPGVIEALKQVQIGEKPIWIVSSHGKPNWLESMAPFIKFCRCNSVDRNSGKVIFEIVAQNQEVGLQLSDLVVLGAKEADFRMAVNAQALFLRCDWVSGMSGQILKYGVPLPSPAALVRVVDLLEAKTPWYFRHESQDLSIFALTNAGTHGLQDPETLNLITELRGCLKDGDRRGKDGFKIHLLSSLSETHGIRDTKIWSSWPSSDSNNDWTEVMDEFSDLARMTFKRRNKSRPLFIRHRQTEKRHRLNNADRTDPTSQLLSVHLNAEYREWIHGNSVVVLDDYLTYGTSFGVAAAFLQAAGAKRVVCVAMGKFGDCARLCPITITGNVFAPMREGDFRINESQWMPGTVDANAQLEFVRKFAEALR